MPRPSELRKYYDALRSHFGHQRWWPGETPFEVIVGAILTQNTAWTNVEKAIQNLRVNRLLDARRLDDIDLETLAIAIRPAGYFHVKAKRVKAFVRWFLKRFGGQVERMRSEPVDRLRNELLAVYGIGRETADSILLYALGHPSFVVDAYTHRVLSRHEFVAEETSYEEMKELFESTLPREPALYNDFHAQLVAVGKNYCRTTPRCEKCPLRKYLPQSSLPAREIAKE